MMPVPVMPTSNGHSSSKHTSTNSGESSTIGSAKYVTHHALVLRTHTRTHVPDTYISSRESTQEYDYRERSSSSDSMRSDSRFVVWALASLASLTHTAC